jgi:hypothetical protein
MFAKPCSCAHFNIPLAGDAGRPAVDQHHRAASNSGTASAGAGVSISATSTDLSVAVHLAAFKFDDFLNREHEVHCAKGFVALKTALDVGRGISRSIGPKSFVFPFAVAQLFGVFGTPACTLLHHDNPI